MQEVVMGEVVDNVRLSPLRLTVARTLLHALVGRCVKKQEVDLATAEMLERSLTKQSHGFQV